MKNTGGNVLLGTTDKVLICDWCLRTNGITLLLHTLFICFLLLLCLLVSSCGLRWLCLTVKLMGLPLHGAGRGFSQHRACPRRIFLASCRRSGSWLCVVRPAETRCRSAMKFSSLSISMSTSETTTRKLTHTLSASAGPWIERLSS